MEDKIEYKSKTGHFWVGLRNGRDFPLNRNVYAMARSQEYRPGLRNGNIFTEFFVAKNPESVRCSCHSMDSVVKKLHFPDGTTPGLMPATWVEFMGIGEKPEPATIAVDGGNDDYRIALDLDAGNCYYQFRDLVPSGARTLNELLSGRISDQLTVSPIDELRRNPVHVQQPHLVPAGVEETQPPNRLVFRADGMQSHPPIDEQLKRVPGIRRITTHLEIPQRVPGEEITGPARDPVRIASLEIESLPYHWTILVEEHAGPGDHACQIEIRRRIRNHPPRSPILRSTS